MQTVASIGAVDAVFDTGRLRLSTQHLPLAIVSLGRGADRDEYAALLDAIERHVLSITEPYVVVTDMRGMGGPPGADVRKLVSDWMRRNQDCPASLGNVSIVGSPLVRGALTALYWLFEPPKPQGVAGTWAEAHAWAIGALEGAGVAIPASVRRLVVQPY